MGMFEQWITIKIDATIPRSIMLESEIKAMLDECRTKEQFRERIIPFLKAAPEAFFALCIENAEFKGMATRRDEQ